LTSFKEEENGSRKKSGQRRFPGNFGSYHFAYRTHPVSLIAYKQTSTETDLKGQIKELQTRMEKMKQDTSTKLDKVRQETANTLEKMGQALKKKEKTP
jgi:hypothetical protein